MPFVELIVGILTVIVFFTILPFGKRIGSWIVNQVIKAFKD